MTRKIVRCRIYADWKSSANLKPSHKQPSRFMRMPDMTEDQLLDWLREQGRSIMQPAVEEFFAENGSN